MSYNEAEVVKADYTLVNTFQSKISYNKASTSICIAVVMKGDKCTKNRFRRAMSSLIPDFFHLSYYDFTICCNGLVGRNHKSGKGCPVLIS